MAERFRDLVRPSLVDVAARSTPSGAEQATMQLSNTLREFSQQTASVGRIFRTQAGEEEGAAAGAEGEPEFRKGFRRLTAYGAAYNDAALRSYAIRAENDLNETAARLETEAGTDPEAFAEAMAKVQENTIAEAPQEAQGILQEIYAKRTSKGLANIQSALAAEVKAEDVELINDQINNLVERVSELRAQDTEEALFESDEEEAKLLLLLDGSVADGTISEVEGRVARRRAQQSIIQGTVVSRFRNEMADPAGDPVGFIEDLKEVNRTSENLSPEDEDKLVNILFAELREQNAIDAARESEANAQADAILAAGDREATARMLAGTLTQADLFQMVVDQELNPSVARTLKNELDSQLSGPTPKSDPDRLLTYEVNLLSFSEQDILTDPLLAPADKADLIDELRTQSQGWKSTQHAKEAFARIDRALDILPGSNVDLLDEDEKRARETALTSLYDIIDALPPEERTPAVVLDTANKVVQESIRERAQRQLAEDRAKLDWLLNKDTSDMGSEELKDHKRLIDLERQDVRNSEDKVRGTQ